MTESSFFQDLAVIMAIAGLAAALFSRLGWPKVIGYIVAGVLMGEHTWGGSFLTNPDSVSVIGQLGVVFLMLAMGFGFSARELRQIRLVALPAAVVDTLVMIWLGYVVSTRFFGWSPVPSLFLGVAICDSATTLLAKVIDEMGWGHRPFSRYVLGTSVCEDIICVGAIAVATGFAQGGTMSVGSLLQSLGWLSVYLLTVVVFGLILVPRFLDSVAKRKEDEVLVLTLLGTTFFVSYIALHLNFSLALGAFLVGFLCSTSTVRDRIIALIAPLKAMFSAIFFVSIGLLVNPEALGQCAGQILLVSAVVVIGKFLNVATMSLLAGVDVKTAIQNGMGLAQIGEFAFMVAILYAGLVKDTNAPLFQIAVGTSLLTTLLNPMMIRLSDRVGTWAENHQPAHLKWRLETYRAWLEKLTLSGGSPAFVLLKGALIRLGVIAVLMLAVATACALLHGFDFSPFSHFFERHDKLIFFLLSNVFTLSLLPLVLPSARTVGDEVAEILFGGGKAVWRLPIQQFVRFAALVAVLGLYFIEWTMINLALAPKGGWVPWFTLGFMLIAAVVGWRFFVKAGRRALARFNEALTAEDRRASLAKSVSVALPEGELHRMTLDVSSPAIGLSVVTLNVRAKTGATIVAVVRDGRVTRNIGPSWEFAVGDLVVATGERPQIAALKDLLGITS